LRFRFLVDEPNEGAFNMAVDEALFLSASEPPGLTTVRLYGFDPPTVSFGYRQTLEDAVDVVSCRELGVDWVKRPTGGRALLHQHEVTYSVASPVGGVFRGFAVRALYDLVSAVIRRTLTGLWVTLDPATLDPAEPERVRVREPALDVPCLALPGRHEITAGGRKVVASSQRRGRQAFLQHGSILRQVDAGLWARVAPRGRPLASLRAVGIDELTPEPVPRELLVSSLLLSFEELFESKAATSGLTRLELERIPELQRKYRSLAF
jgi:lipoate-protein ligase A